MNKDQLKKAWRLRCELYAKAQRKYRQAEFSFGSASALSMDDHLDKVNRFREQGASSYKDGRDLILEADLLWERSVSQAGLKVMAWKDANLAKGSYSCLLSDGSLYKP